MEYEPDLMTPITETPLVERKTFLPTVIVKQCMEHVPVETKDFSNPSVFFVSPSLFVNQDIGKYDETQKIKQNT